jgi:hypothetical protein
MVKSYIILLGLAAIPIGLASLLSFLFKIYWLLSGAIQDTHAGPLTIKGSNGHVLLTNNQINMLAIGFPFLAITIIFLSLAFKSGNQ